MFNKDACSHPRGPWEIRGGKMKIIIAITMLLMSSLAMAHSGGTDKDGCHVDSKTGYKHCH